MTAPRFRGRCLLAPLYAGVTALRRRAYRRGWRKRHSLPVPVIVVGNITAGGTGKTPLTIALVERPCGRLEAGRPAAAMVAKTPTSRCAGRYANREGR